MILTGVWYSICVGGVFEKLVSCAPINSKFPQAVSLQKWQRFKFLGECLFTVPNVESNGCAKIAFCKVKYFKTSSCTPQSWQSFFFKSGSVQRRSTLVLTEWGFETTSIHWVLNPSPPSCEKCTRDCSWEELLVLRKSVWNLNSWRKKRSNTFWMVFKFQELVQIETSNLYAKPQPACSYVSSVEAGTSPPHALYIIERLTN